MNQTEQERCDQINHDLALDQHAFEAAWTAFQDTPIDMVADSDDEQCRCVRNAILAYFNKAEVLSTRQPEMSVLTDATVLADEYEAGMQKCAASGYEEYGPDFQKRQQLIIKALRAYATSQPNRMGTAIRDAAERSTETRVRWAVNAMLEQIAEKFEGWDTLDLFRSEAAATVRGFKRNIAQRSPPQPHGHHAGDAEDV